MSYLVPNTQTRLNIFFGRPMDSVILQALLESVRNFCAITINRDGDSILRPDPYSRNGPWGGNVQMRSVQDHHLTWMILKYTMQGLLNVLVIGEQESEVEVEVFDMDWILLGIGNVGETIRLGNMTEKRSREELRVSYTIVDMKTT